MPNVAGVFVMQAGTLQRQADTLQRQARLLLLGIKADASNSKVIFVLYSSHICLVFAASSFSNKLRAKLRVLSARPLAS